MFRSFAIATGFAVLAAPVAAAGYLGARAEALEPLRIGIGADGFAMEPKRYRLETGKGYRLRVESTGVIECELNLREFLDDVWVRQVKAGEVEFAHASFSVVELDDEGAFELTFVPIRPGEYEFGCQGLEDRGLAGTIVVE